MDEYIKREQVLKLLESAQAWGWSMNTLYDEMQELPAADVVPVVHGKWIQYLDTDEWACSNCEATQICFDFTPKELGMSYCPNCGAKMDLEG